MTMAYPEAYLEGVLFCPQLSSEAAVYRLRKTHIERLAGTRADSKFAPIRLSGAAIILNPPLQSPVVYRAGALGVVDLTESFDIVPPPPQLAIRFFSSSKLSQRTSDATLNSGSGSSSGALPGLTFLSASAWASALMYAAIRQTYPLHIPHDKFSAPIDGSVHTLGAGDDDNKEPKLLDFLPSKRIIKTWVRPPDDAGASSTAGAGAVGVGVTSGDLVGGADSSRSLLAPVQAIIVEGPPRLSAQTNISKLVLHPPEKE